VNDRVNVNIIRAFEGPRHDVLEAIWYEYLNAHNDEICVWVYDNRGDHRWSHATALQRMWEDEKQRPEPIAVFTEFDFLPAPGFAQRVGQTQNLTVPTPIEAAEYCDRNMRTMALRPKGIPGAWFIRVNKSLLHAEPYFWAGPGEDPANHLGRDFEDKGQAVVLLPQEDCLPEHLGTRTVPYGEHLFYSRHYNNTPADQAGVPHLPAVLHGVDTAINNWWEQWRRA
jgi:hypothetical protein